MDFEQNQKPFQMEYKWAKSGKTFRDAATLLSVLCRLLCKRSLSEKLRPNLSVSPSSTWTPTSESWRAFKKNLRPAWYTGDENENPRENL